MLRYYHLMIYVDIPERIIYRQVKICVYHINMMSYDIY